jgi:hypothetical protein
VAEALASAELPPELSVFVNCPFDDTYLPLLRAMVFTIHDCGFIARLAIEDAGSGETRIDKIARIVESSRLSIHDISRVELSAGSQLPRFNMPFECGLAWGRMLFGRSDLQRDLLLLDSKLYQDKQTLSDLAGQDPSYHGNDPHSMISKIRHFLAKKKPAGEKTRGGAAIVRRFAAFETKLPELCARVDISMDEIHRFDYLGEWMVAMSEWLLEPGTHA